MGFKQTSYWGKNCNPKPKVPPKNKRFHLLGSGVAFPISPRRPNNKPLSSAATPSPRQLKQALKENNIRAGSSLTATRHHVVITKKEIDNIWKPQVDSVNLNNPQHRIEQFDLNYSQKSPLYKKHIRSVQNQTPVAYPKIDYDVDDNNKFPNLDRLIKKHSTLHILAQERLAAVKERKKAIKREANEKALSRMIHD